MILIIGTLYDEMIEVMCARLNQLKYNYFLVDSLNLTKNKITWKATGGKQEFLLSNQKIKINSEDVTGIYCRFTELKTGLRYKGMSEKESLYLYNESLSCIVNVIDNFPRTVVNRLMNSLSNESKIYQQIQISKMGFLTPKTMVTNDPGKIQSFYRSCNEKIIFKSISNIRSIVTKFSPKHFSNLDLVKNCPVQFQEMIEGLEIRVHTIGDKVFATAIKSDAVDYRYAGKDNKSAEFFSYDLPAKISKACISLSRSFGLEVAGIDLKRTSDGKYYCFEVNPSPAFIAFERMTGQAISKEVAMLLKGK